jgi:hypothetical protein
MSNNRLSDMPDEKARGVPRLRQSLNGWQPRQLVAFGSCCSSPWWQLAQAARSLLAAVSWLRWQSAQRPCWATAWRPGSLLRVWQLAQLGGAARPPGPCGRWQVAHPPSRLPWRAFFWLAWQEAQVAWTVPACSSWQLAQERWPAGAERCSAAWQLAQAATGARGAWRACWWHPTHWRCPVATSPTCFAWQVAQAGGVRVAAWPAERWQLVQVACPVAAAVRTSDLWQSAHSATPASFGRWIWCGRWQVAQATPAAWLAVDAWHDRHSMATAPRTAASALEPR